MVSGRIKYAVQMLSVFLIIFVIIFPIKTYALTEEQNYKEEILEGKVTQIIEEREISEDGENWQYQKLEILVTKGSLKGQTMLVENGVLNTAGSQSYKMGDQLVITKTSGSDITDQFLITDYVRRDGLLNLFVLFVALAIFVGGIWGAASLLGMGYSFLVIFKFMLPLLLAGYNAVLIAVLGSVLIIPVTFVLSHGWKRKTGIAILGTIISLTLTGFIAAFFVEAIHLTGFAAEEAGFLQFQLGDLVNMQGLLLAGIIIASLGILDDITISQASIVEEIREANNKLKPAEVFARAMKVGRDHIASLINTLVLVYTGASLPLLLLFINNPHPFIEVVNYEIIADEVMRTLVGSIGLILAVPITTFLAVISINIKKS